MAEKSNHRAKRKVAAAAEKKVSTTIPRQTHMQTSLGKVKETGEHQDDDVKLDSLTFMQNKETNNKMIQEQRARGTLKPSYIYLDPISFFHQMFGANYMSDVMQVKVALHRKYNTEESHQ